MLPVRIKWAHTCALCLAQAPGPWERCMVVVMALMRGRGLRLEPGVRHFQRGVHGGELQPWEGPDRGCSAAPRDNRALVQSMGSDGGRGVQAAPPGAGFHQPASLTETGFEKGIRQ